MHLQLIPQVTLEEQEIGRITLVCPTLVKLEWNDNSLAIGDILLNLQKGISKSSLEESVENKNNPHALYMLYCSLERLSIHGLLSFSVIFQDSPLFTLTPLQPSFKLIENAFSQTEVFQLSRFCCLRTLDDEMILETPLSAMRLYIKKHEAMNLLLTLAKPRTLSELNILFPQLPEEVLHETLALLSSAKVLSDNHEDKDPTLAQWEFQDLFFHSRSRLGRHNNAYGGTYPFTGKTLPISTFKPYASSLKIPLYRPDIEKLMNSDRSFTSILESRKSIRQQSNKPLSIKELGEFLFRAARVKTIYKGAKQELTQRPYPSGGALYELEIYLLIHNCEGAAPGLYHYDSKDHQLSKLTDPTIHTDALLQNARKAISSAACPQILITLSSRFQKRSWKYESTAYSTTLKNVGTLIQTMYLVATAMDLAPCAVGGGNSDLFSKIIQSNYLEETSVGEFILGSTPHTE